MARIISTTSIINWIRMKLNSVPSPDANTSYGRFYLLATGQLGVRMPNGTDWLAAKSDHTHANSVPSFVVGDAGKFLNVNGTGTATEWDSLVNADLPNSGVAAATYTHATVTVNTKGIVVSASSNATATPTDNLDYRGRRAVINVNSSRTLQLTDRNALLLCNAPGAVILTVPTEASVAFAVNDEIDIVRYMASSVTIAAAVGVTINHAGGLAILTQNRAVWLKKIATNEWLLLGDL